jgi:uncharacterized protein (TIGR02001 family)
LRIALRETLLTRLHGILALACLAVSGLATADGSRVVTGSLGGTSDFVFRGISLTRGKPTAQASLDVEFSREFYVGGFIAGTDPNPGPSPRMEFDVWAGKYWRLEDDLSLDLRVSQYTYPDDPRRISYNRSELTGTLGFRDRLFVSAIYSPNTRAVGSSPGYGEAGAWALEMSGRHAFNDRLSLSVGAGYYGLEDVYHDNFLYWNATLIATVRPLEFQLAWLGIDDAAEEHFRRDSIGNRLAFTALWRFSSP